MRSSLFVLFLLTGIVFFGTTAESAPKGCTFKLQIKNSTSYKITIRKLSYRHSEWERIVGSKVEIKAGKTKTKGKFNLALRCFDRHDWVFLYKCNKAGQLRKKLKKSGLKGKGGQSIAMTKVEIKDCTGSATWTKP